MVSTRNQAITADLFNYLPSDPEPEIEDSMSTSATIDDNTNPYSQKINLTDKTGLSLFREACKGLDDDDKLLLQIENAQAFKEEVDRAAAEFCWGTVCSDISDSSSTSRNLLTDYKSLTMSDLKMHADTTWGCTTRDNLIPAAGSSFNEVQQQRRIRCSMMAKWVRKSLLKSDQRLLDLSKKTFQYTHAVKKTIEEDGPLMLKIIYDRINPSTRVGVRNLISKLFKFNLADFNQDVPKMSDSFEETYNQILDKKEASVSPESAYFDALLTCTNEDFLAGIKLELTKWESGTVMTFADLKSDAITKYNNISERLKKDNKSFDGKSIQSLTESSLAVDSDKAKIIALSTQLQEVKQQLANAFATSASGTSVSNKTSFSHPGNSGRKPNIEAWRMSKTLGDKVQREGKWYFWCPHHKYSGFYDGLYVTHPPEKHDEWKDRQDKFKKRGKYAASSSGGNSGSSGSSGVNSGNKVKLVLSDTVKQALITDHGFNPLQIEQLERGSGN